MFFGKYMSFVQGYFIFIQKNTKHVAFLMGNFP